MVYRKIWVKKNVQKKLCKGLCKNESLQMYERNNSELLVVVDGVVHLLVLHPVDVGRLDQRTKFR